MPRLSLTQSLADRTGTIGELFAMLRRHRLWWAIPAFALLVLLGLVLAGLQSVPYVAPFIYTVF